MNSSTTYHVSGEKFGASSSLLSSGKASSCSTSCSSTGTSSSGVTLSSSSMGSGGDFNLIGFRPLLLAFSSLRAEELLPTTIALLVAALAEDEIFQGFFAVIFQAYEMG